MMNYKETVGHIYGLKGSEHKGKYNLSLENVKILLGKLGNPEKSLKVIHVAGTNGKGSVCAMLSSILIEAGYNVGMYTSPHLIDFRERFFINCKKISKKDLVKYFDKVKQFVTNQTFFEVITAIAFLYFKDRKVDYLVLEVGLGGRLDATNVVRPLVSVITNIGIEHQEYLGDTVEKIAYEKAGIIKEGVCVVTGAKGTALKVIKEIAKKKHSSVYVGGNVIGGFPLRLKGDFQLLNASIALETIKVLGSELKTTEKIIKKGLLKTIWHGRLEFVSDNVLVDCAHNLDAVKVLRNELRGIKYDKLCLLIGILEDKDYRNILKELVPMASKVILVKPKVPRAIEPSELAKYVEKDFVIMKDIKKALDYAKKVSGKKDLILITGSIFVVGEALGRE